MKKKIVSILLILTLLSLLTISPISLSADTVNYSKQYLEPIFLDEYIKARPAATAITNTTLTDFTADIDYTVKSGETAGITFDMPMYYHNDGTKPISIKSGSGTITNTDAGKILMRSTIQASRGLITENLVDSVSEFEMTFDISNVTWGQGQICFGTYSKHATGSHMMLLLRGASYDSQFVLYDYSLSTTKIGTYTIGKNISGNMKITCADGLFKVYYNDTEIFNYTLPTGDLYDGPIYATCYNEPLTYDNIVIKAPYSTYNTDNYGYYEVHLGEKVTLGRNINGSFTELASSENVLSPDKMYNFKIIRNTDSVDVLADEDKLLSAEITHPYTEENISLWQGYVGTVASAVDDSFEKLSIYDSANLNFAGGFANISPLQTTADNLKIASQGLWGTTWEPDSESSNATFTDDGKGNFTLSSPTTLNSHAVFDGFLKKEYGDVYITFNAINSRANYSYDNIYFAGYNIQFARDGALGAVTVTDPNGTAVNLTGDYTTAFYSSYYKFELLKKGNTVSVYYYPSTETRTLLFTDSNATAKTNFSIKKRQGTLTLSSFTIYDAIPTGEKENLYIQKESLYKECADGIGCIPMGTTVREVRANLIHRETAKITRNGETLDDTDTVLTGDIIEFNNIAVKLNIGTIGDLNGDGKIDSSDVTLAESAINAPILTAALCSADIDQNGAIEQNDIELLSEIAKGNSDTKYLKRSIVGDALFENFKMVGRQYYESGKGVNFEMNAASITIAGYMKGDVTVTIDNDISNCYIDDVLVVYIDGDRHFDIFDDFVQLEKGLSTYVVATGLKEGYHTIEVIKSNNPAVSAFYLRAVGMTGTPAFEPYSDRRIEIIGDSIAAGAGQYVGITRESGSGVSIMEMGYASRAARLLGADYYGIANGGWAFYKRYPNTIERIYDLASDVREPEVKYDFSDAKNDLVYINLGTNDNSTLYSEYQTQGENFDFEAAKTEWKAGVKTLLNKVRANNPDAKIIWGHGAMGFGFADNNGQTTGDWIREAVEEYNEADGKVAFLKLRPTQRGIGGHPDPIGSIYLAKETADFIADFMGWDYETPELPDYKYGDIIKNYTFDGSKQGFYTNFYYGTYLAGNNKIGIDWNANISSYSVGLAEDKLDTYEMSLDWEHVKDSGNNRETLVLRSPNESLDNAIYLTTLGTNAANDGDNVKLYISQNGVQTEIGSTFISDLYSSAKKIKVKMGIDRLDVIIWNSTDDMPQNTTFSVSLKDIGVKRGNIFINTIHSHNLYGNIEIKYGVSVDVIGDLDDSSKLDAKDIVLMRRYLLGVKDDINNFATDVNQDSSINLRDLVRIKKEAVNNF